MARKPKRIRIRVDDALRQALKASAIRGYRSPTRHAAYLIRLMLKYEHLLPRANTPFPAVLLPHVA